MNISDTNEANPFRSDIDKYIYSILERLDKHYFGVSCRRVRGNVKFKYNTDNHKPQHVFDMFIGNSVNVTYSELENCMKNNTLPKQIKDIL